MAPAATLRRRGIEFSADGAKELFRLPPEHQRKSHARRAHDLIAVAVIRAVPLADVFKADRDDPVPLFFDKQIGPSDIPTVVIEAARPQAAPAEQKLVDISNIDKGLDHSSPDRAKRIRRADPAIGQPTQGDCRRQKADADKIKPKVSGIHGGKNQKGNADKQ